MSAHATAGFDIAIDQLDRRLPLGSDNPDASGYLDAAQGFCPYIRPAMEARALFQSQYSLSELRALSACGIAAEGLLYAAIVHTEWLRLRRAACEPATRPLICDTFVITDDERLGWEQLAELVMWPHWLLKYLYSSAGIMFANFWRGYVSSSAGGREIPPPPRTFSAIRSAVPVRDSHFLTADGNVAAFIRDSCDQGQNVHLRIAPVEVGRTFSAVALRELNYFSRARLWSRDLLPRSARRGPDQAGASANERHDG